MATIGDLVLTVTGDYDEFKRNAQTQGQAAGTAASTGFSAGFKKMAVAGFGLAAGFVGFRAVSEVIDAVGNSIELASSKAESLSKVRVVFGETAGVIEEFARTASTSLGISEGAALEALGTFGNLFVSMGLGQDVAADMSIGINQLAADLGSFNNMGTEEVLDKIRAGLVGETEPLRALGVNLNAAAIQAKAMEMGLEDAHGELSAGAKAQAAYALILEQTTTAQGDFAETSSGLANTQRINAARMEDALTKLGETLMPIVQTIVPMLADALVAVIEGVSELATVVGTVLGPAFQMLGETVATMKGHLDNFLSVLQTIRDVADPQGVALRQAAADFIEMAQAAGLTAEETEAAWQRIQDGAIAGAENFEEAAARSIDAQVEIGDAADYMELRGTEAFRSLGNVVEDTEPRLTGAFADVASSSWDMTHAANAAFAALAEGADDSADDVVATFANLPESLRDKFARMKDETRAAMADIAWAIKHPFSEAEFANYLRDQIEIANRKRNRALEIGDDAAVREIDGFVAEANRLLTSIGGTITVTTQFNGIRPSRRERLTQHRARGGHQAAGEMGIIGEEGPEFWMPETSGTVKSNNWLRSALGQAASIATNATNSTLRVEHNLTREGAAALRDEGFDEEGVAGFLRNLGREYGLPPQTAR